jgi:hypothetical protein
LIPSRFLFTGKQVVVARQIQGISQQDLLHFQYSLKTASAAATERT